MRLNVHAMKPRRNGTRFKLIVVGLVVFTIFYIVYFHIRDADKAAERRFFADNFRLLDAGNETECRLPRYDLYDVDIRPYIDQPPISIECGNPQPYLTYLDWDGKLYLNETELEVNDYRDLRCTFESIRGDRDNDYKVVYSAPIEIETFPITISEPTIRVKCTDDEDPIYTMVHSQILPPPSEDVHKNKNIPPHRPSVLIFIVDSMSRGNFIRALPKTYDYLTNRRKMNIFKGLNKVADNTFPNIMALLTGFIGYPRNDMAHVPTWTISWNSTTKHYDDMPIVWKTFKEAGYVTMYAEEYLDATFSYLDVGFQDDPVDYYYRPVYVSLKENLANLKFNKLKFWNRSKWRYCLGNQPSYKYMLNYTEEFLTEMAHIRYFALSFFVEMSHEYLNDAKNMDDDLVAFFKRIFERGHLDNTVLIVMGDHGHRFDGIRSTFIGRIEERMPFLGITLPQSLKASHPHLEAALEGHTERLLSWYDVHQMLVDLALDDLNVEQSHPRIGAVGKSIFRPFDEHRSCVEIGILPEYCMCDREVQLDMTTPKATETANIIVQHVNDMLMDSYKFLKINESRNCAFLSLSKISSATVSMKSLSSGPPSLVVRVILSVTPSDALLEGGVKFTTSDDPIVYGDINRINKYENQSSCINHDILRLYCYCI